MQKHSSEFKERGVTLAVLSAELPNTSLDMMEKLELEFPVLSDVGEYVCKIV
jgi:peroxiredoxin